MRAFAFQIGWADSVADAGRIGCGSIIALSKEVYWSHRFVAGIIGYYIRNHLHIINTDPKECD